MTTEEFTSFEAYTGEDGLNHLAALLFRPAELCVRTQEFIDLSSDTPTRRTVKDFEGLTSKVLVPIALPKRDELIDNLTIEATENVRSYALSGQLTIVTLRFLLLRAAQAAGLDPDSQPDVDELCKQVPVLGTDAAFDRIDEFRKHLLSTHNSSLTVEQVGFLNALQLFARRRPLLVPCRPDDVNLQVRFSRDISFVEMQHRGSTEFARGAVGRAPDRVTFDVPLATRSRSYHLRLKAPADYYVREFFCERKQRTRVRHDDRRVWVNYASLHPTDVDLIGIGANPTEFAHLRLSDASEAPSTRHGVVVRARLAERPLGRVGSATARIVFAITAAALLLRFGSKIALGTNAAVTSVLLGLPGLLGASIIATRTQARVREPLLARLGTFVSIASVLATSVALLTWNLAADRAGVKMGAVSSSNSFPAPTGVLALLWIVLTISSAVLSVLIGFVALNYVQYSRAVRAQRHR